MNGPLPPFVSFWLLSVVLTDELESEIFVFLDLFGVLPQEDDSMRDAAVL